MCTSCGGAVAKNFNKIVGWIEAFIGKDLKDFNDKNAEELIEEGNERVELAEEKKQEAREKKIKDAAKKAKALKNKREADKKKKEADKKRRKTNAEKKRAERKAEKAKAKEDKTADFEAKRKAKEAEQAQFEKFAKDFSGELIVTREEVEELGTAEEIIAHVEKSTGIKIDIDPKSKQQIIESAVSIYRRIEAIQDGNEEAVNEFENKTKEELQAICKERGIEFHPRNNEESLIALLTA